MEDSLMYDYMFHQGDFISFLFGEGFGRVVLIRKMLASEKFKITIIQKTQCTWFLGDFIWRVYSRCIHNYTHTRTHVLSSLCGPLLAEARYPSPSEYIKGSSPILVTQRTPWHMLSLPSRSEQPPTLIPWEESLDWQEMGNWLLSASKGLHQSDFF